MDAEKIAIDCLTEICGDHDAKQSDRIAAAKLLLEHGGAGDGGLTVVMEGIPREYCE